MSLPFWYDGLELFYYLPEHVLITLEQAYNDYGITSEQIMGCKAWWNTNIPMDHFVPTIIPCDNKDAGIDICLTNFIERVKQRAEGKMVPSPPELKVMPGIMALNKEKEFKGVFINHPNDPSIIRFLEVETNLLNGTFIAGEVITRDPNHLYWDMIERRYV